MLTAETAQPVDSKRASFANYGKQMRVWRQATNLGPSKKASVLNLQMDVFAHQVRVTAGGDVITDGEGTEKIRNISRRYCAPVAVDRCTKRSRVLCNLRARIRRWTSPWSSMIYVAVKRYPICRCAGLPPKHLYLCFACSAQPYGDQKNHRR